MKNIDDINPNIFWYVVGYIATDGSLSKDGRHISITSKDHEHLTNIKNKLGITSNIIRKARGNEKEKKYSVIQIGSVSFYKFLNSIGMFSRKTWNMGELQVDQKYWADFLRGVIDGDGCIYSWKHRTNGHIQWSLRISGAAPKFIKWVKEITELELSVNGKLHEHQHKTNATMYIIKFGKIATQKILKSVYYDNCFCIDRKLTKTKECLHDESKMLKYGGVVNARVM